MLMMMQHRRHPKLHRICKREKKWSSSLYLRFYCGHADVNASSYLWCFAVTFFFPYYHSFFSPLLNLRKTTSPPLSPRPKASYRFSNRKKKIHIYTLIHSPIYIHMCVDARPRTEAETKQRCRATCAKEEG